MDFLGPEEVATGTTSISVVAVSLSLTGAGDGAEAGDAGSSVSLCCWLRDAGACGRTPPKPPRYHLDRGADLDFFVAHVGQLSRDNRTFLELDQSDEIRSVLTIAGRSFG